MRTNERLSDLLVGAFEGGSNYWIDHIEYICMPRTHGENPLLDVGGDPAYAHFHLYPEGTIRVFVIEDNAGLIITPYDLTIEKLRVGLEIMNQKYPEHYANFIAENDDAETADVALQCALFGEVIYG